MIKIIFSQKHENVLEKFKDLAQKELPELVETILFTNSPSGFNDAQKRQILQNEPVYVGSIFTKDGTYCDEYHWTTDILRSAEKLVRVMFTTTSPVYEMDQIKKYGFNGRREYYKPLKDLIVIPKSDENFLFMVKAIIENWDSDKGFNLMKEKFTYVKE